MAKSLKAALVAAILVTAACGDDVTTTPTTASSSSSSSSTGAGAAGGGDPTGGAGGEGGSGECIQPSVSGDDPVVEELNGCTLSDLTDSRGQAEVEISYGFADGAFVYDPKCLLVSPCTTITFNVTDGTNFSIHPLVPGTENNEASDSPIPKINDMNEDSVSFLVEDEGAYPYICQAHVTSGMVGVIYVQQ